MTGPSCSAIIRRVALASSASEVKGFCTAVTWKPRDSRIGIVFAQQLPSANAPWTSTMFLTMSCFPPVSCGGCVRLAHARAARTPKLPARITLAIFIGISSLNGGVRCGVSSNQLGRFSGWKVGPDGDALPGFEVAAQDIEFLVRQPERVLAEEQMERWGRRFDRLDDRVRCADGVARLPATEVPQLAAL